MNLKMFLYKSGGKYLLMLIMLTSLYSCKEMDATYSEYVEGGEIVYVSKADSLKAFPGKGRILLTWERGTDPKVTKAQIFWNNGESMVEHMISPDSHTGVEEVLLEDLPEGSYTFEVITYDAKGNTSVRVNTSGTVYGEDYIASLQTRRYRRAIVRDQHIHIDWYNAPQDAVGVEVRYMDKDGQRVTLMASSELDTTVLLHYKNKTEISYRTLFVPEGNAIDTFYSAYNTIVPEYLLDKTKFSRWNTPDFPYTEYNMGSGYNIEKLWDEVYTGYGYIYLETQPLPRSFTFDLGQLASIERIRLSPNWESQLYRNGNIKKAEIWGSATPEVSGDFSTWTYLGSLESVKPSGLPLGQATDEDLAYAKAGEDFDLEAGTPPVRYIRFVVQDTWSGSISMHITELTFWGQVVPE